MERGKANDSKPFQRGVGQRAEWFALCVRVLSRMTQSKPFEPYALVLVAAWCGPLNPLSRVDEPKVVE